MPAPDRATPSRAVVLLSGGLDSATVLAIARRDGFDCHALSFDYGQRHAVELTAADTVASSAGLTEHTVIRLDAQAFRGSALTGGAEVPKHDAVGDLGTGIPATYVPARNTVF